MKTLIDKVNSLHLTLQQLNQYGQVSKEIVIDDFYELDSLSVSIKVIDNYVEYIVYTTEPDQDEVLRTDSLSEVIKFVENNK